MRAHRRRSGPQCLRSTAPPSRRSCATSALIWSRLARNAATCAAEGSSHHASTNGTALASSTSAPPSTMARRLAWRARERRLSTASWLCRCRSCSSSTSVARISSRTTASRPAACCRRRSSASAAVAWWDSAASSSRPTLTVLSSMGSVRTGPGPPPCSHSPVSRPLHAQRCGRDRAREDALRALALEQPASHSASSVAERPAATAVARRS